MCDDAEVAWIHPPKARLHLGCGRRILPDHVNVDIVPHEGVDLVCDLAHGIPFHSNSFDELLAEDFLEHLRQEDCIPFMNEAHRVLRPRGVFRIHVPEAPGITASQDPTHLSHWNEETLTYYLDGHRRRDTYGVYYGVTARFTLVSLRRTRYGGWRKFLRTGNRSWLSNYLLDLVLKAVKSETHGKRAAGNLV